jgi:DNA-directed RNA polymerase subunit K/omega
VAVKPIPMQEFTDKVGNIYEAIVATSKRSRQIHDDMKIELAQRLETIKALTMTTEAEEDLEVTTTNPDQLKISLEFEQRPKPTEMALEQVGDRRVTFRYKEREVPPVVKEKEKEEEEPDAE